jgi:ABC-type dipeptide/oligopeptide/nickel transport system permease component
MNRRIITTAIVAISILLNLVFIVFAVVQKAAADTAREMAVQNEQRSMEQSKLFKVQLDQCEGARTQVEKALEECEQRVLNLSNRKK